MNKLSLGEFEELVLLTVAMQHDEAYGVSAEESLEEKLEKKIDTAQFIWFVDCTLINLKVNATSTTQACT